MGPRGRWLACYRGCWHYDRHEPEKKDLHEEDGDFRDGHFSFLGVLVVLGIVSTLNVARAPDPGECAHLDAMRFQTQYSLINLIE